MQQWGVCVKGISQVEMLAWVYDDCPRLFGFGKVYITRSDLKSRRVWGSHVVFEDNKTKIAVIQNLIIILKYKKFDEKNLFI